MLIPTQCQVISEFRTFQRERWRWFFFIGFIYYLFIFGEVGWWCVQIEIIYLKLLLLQLILIDYKNENTAICSKSACNLSNIFSNDFGIQSI